jgi:chemotaxis protein MotB
VNRTTTVSTLLLTTVLSIGCGYSEDQMKAQVDAKKKCDSDLASERAAKDKMATELADLKKQIANLTSTTAEKSAKAEELQKALADAEARAKALEAMKKRLEALKNKLDELKKFGIETKVRNGLITIVMPGDVLFPPGKETLSKEGMDALGKIAAVIKDTPDLAKRRFQIIGHTDNTPYTGAFKDNVGLSVMRAREVYEFLTSTPDKKKNTEGGGLDPLHLSAAGFGDLDPLAGSRKAQTLDQKKKNRRVEIAILPNADELMKLDV